MRMILFFLCLLLTNIFCNAQNTVKTKDGKSYNVTIHEFGDSFIKVSKTDDSTGRQVKMPHSFIEYFTSNDLMDVVDAAKEYPIYKKLFKKLDEKGTLQEFDFNLKKAVWKKEDQTEEYIFVVGTQKFLSNKLTIGLQTATGWEHIRGENGQYLEFENIAQALNYLNSKGWEFLNAFAVFNEASKSHVYNYLLKKKIK